MVLIFMCMYLCVCVFVLRDYNFFIDDVYVYKQIVT